MEFMQGITAIAVVAIVMYTVFSIVKMGIRYSENIERIKHGYPTLDGAVPLDGAPKEGEAGFNPTAENYGN